MNKILITNSMSFEAIRQEVGKLREQKGREKETLKLIDQVLLQSHEFTINLFLEEALTHQHLYMNDQSNKKALFDMEKSVLKASSYVNTYKLTQWNSRLFRFMGRIADYKGQYKEAIGYYKRAIKLIKSEPETFRILELEAFLSFSTIMSGSFNNGLKMSKETYSKFNKSSIGKTLKKNDYSTWAIWMSGITIRTVGALLDKKVRFNLEAIEKWIADTEKYISSSDKFSYRKAEIKNLRAKLKELHIG